jgi:hypothetical protein
MLSEEIKKQMLQRNYSTEEIYNLEKLGTSDKTIIAWFKIIDNNEPGIIKAICHELKIIG